MGYIIEHWNWSIFFIGAIAGIIFTFILMIIIAKIINGGVDIQT